jgi:hypothetical protein
MSSNSPTRWLTAPVVVYLNLNAPWTCCFRTGLLRLPGGAWTRKVECVLTSNRAWGSALDVATLAAQAGRRVLKAREAQKAFCGCCLLAQRLPCGDGPGPCETASRLLGMGRRCSCAQAEDSPGDRQSAWSLIRAGSPSDRCRTCACACGSDARSRQILPRAPPLSMTLLPSPPRWPR